MTLVRVGLWIMVVHAQVTIFESRDQQAVLIQSVSLPLIVTIAHRLLHSVIYAG